MDVVVSENIPLEIVDRSVNERSFIHDLSNKLQVAFGMSEISIRNMKDSDSKCSDEAEEELRKLKNSLKVIINEIKDRRVVLHGISKVQKKSTMIE